MKKSIEEIMSSPLDSRAKITQAAALLEDWRLRVVCANLVSYGEADMTLRTVGEPTPQHELGSFLEALGCERNISMSSQSDPNGTTFTYVMPAEKPADVPMSYTDAAKMLDVTRGRVSQLVQSGQLDTIEIGGRKMILKASVEQRLAESPQGGRPAKN